MATPFHTEALARRTAVPLAEQLAARYAERIEQRLLAPGARLPSVREAARRHGLSPSTVVAAYDQLQARGLVEAKRQRGFFVREPRAQAPARRAAGARADDGATRPVVDATTLIRGMFQRGLPGPGMGTLPADWLDLPLLHGALKRAMAGDDSALRYGEPAGDLRLREAVAAGLADLGVPATPGQIVTTAGATHALDLVSRALLQPGDAVLVDEPGWAVEFARLSRMGMKLLPVPRGQNGEPGPDLNALAALLAAHRPRLYVTVSVLHNPTGASLPLAAAHRLLKLAEAHALTIVEDDTYAHLASPHAPRLSALDGLQRTVYVSGYSKILTPNWRVGYLAAPPSLVDRFIDQKLLGGLSTPSLPERAIALCLERGALRRHSARVIAQLDAARSRAAARVLEAGCRFVTPPAGLFGWIDVGCDTDRLAEALLDDGWLTAPGSLFHATARPTTLMRINFASAQDLRFWRALQRQRDRLAATTPAQPAPVRLPLVAVTK
jgi:DNA-binding transcriptional MocR family regulator